MHGASPAVEIECNELVGGLSVDVDQVPSELQAGMSLTAIRQQWQGGDDSTISSSVGGDAPGGKTQLGGRRGGASLLGGNSSSREGGTMYASSCVGGDARTREDNGHRRKRGEGHCPCYSLWLLLNLRKGTAIHFGCY